MVSLMITKKRNYRLNPTKNGGQVYMDGAKHECSSWPSLQLWKYRCRCLSLKSSQKLLQFPHGGGNQEQPICVVKHLVPLPQNPNIPTGGSQGMMLFLLHLYGSALVLNISYAYIKMFGAVGLRNSTEFAIINANYLKEVLQHFQFYMQIKKEE